MSYKTYDLGNNSVINWRKSIDNYYKKGLPSFKDTPTIRHQLSLCDDFLTKDAAMIDSLKAAGSEAGDVMDFIEAFGGERAAIIEIKKELEDWLVARQQP